MGSTDTKKVGYPKSSLKRDFQLLRYCGGGGSSGCAVPQTNTKFTFVLRVHPYAVKINDLVLLNPEVNTVRFWTDAGVSGPCPNSKGTEQPWYLATSTDDTLTGAEIMAQSNVFSGAGPYEIELPADKLPQPSDPSWDSEIYVHVYWGSTAFVSDIDFTDWTQWLKIVKLNLEVRQ